MAAAYGTQREGLKTRRMPSREQRLSNEESFQPQRTRAVAVPRSNDAKARAENEKLIHPRSDGSTHTESSFFDKKNVVMNRPIPLSQTT